MTLQRIISGGQTGVDRAALDAALDAGFPCGGYCPKGRLAEDGRIPDRYPVEELPMGGYRQRTLRNIRDADATVVFYRTEMTGGTLTTANHCEKTRKPLLSIDASTLPAEAAALAVLRFIRDHSVATLNVAGPRASTDPKTATFASDVVGRVLSAFA